MTPTVEKFFLKTATQLKGQNICLVLTHKRTILEVGFLWLRIFQDHTFKLKFSKFEKNQSLKDVTKRKRYFEGTINKGRDQGRLPCNTAKQIKNANNAKYDLSGRSGCKNIIHDCERLHPNF